MISRNKFPVVMLLCIWFLSSNSFLFPRQTSEEQTAATTTANSTSFRVVATKSIVMSFTNAHAHTLTSVFSKSNKDFTNTHMQQLTSYSFNAPATTFVSKLPQTLLPYFTITNASDTRSEKIFSSHNILSNKVSKLIHGAIHTSNSSTLTSVVS
jgi:hypothetical protein